MEADFSLLIPQRGYPHSVLNFLVDTPLHPYLVFVIFVLFVFLLMYLFYFIRTRNRNPFKGLSSKKRFEVIIFIVAGVLMTWFFYRNFFMPLVYDYPDPPMSFLSAVVSWLEDWLVNIGILE